MGWPVASVLIERPASSSSSSSSSTSFSLLSTSPSASGYPSTCERIFESLECFFFLVGPDDGGTFLWGSFEKIGQWQSHFRKVPDVAPVMVGKVVESTY